MWGSEDGAETMALNPPWNGVPHNAGGWSVGGGNGGMAAAGSTRGPGGFSGGRGPQGGARGAPAWDLANGGPANGAPVGAPWQQHIPPATWGVPPQQPGAMPPVNLGNAPWQGGPPHMPQQWGMPPAGYVDPMKQRNMRMQTPIQQRFDQPPSWGGIKPSDQGVPWDASSNQPHEKEWGMPAANNAMSGGGGGGGGGRGGWQAGPSVPPAQNANNTWNSAQVKDWQNPPQRPDLINQNLWQQPPGPQQVIVPNQWAQPAPPAPVEQSRLQYDLDPQTPGPWVAPLTTEINNDMFWHDPNPKQRKVQRDIGTQGWGDPNSQQLRFQEIRRWKDADGPEYQCGTGPPPGNDWTQLSFSNSATVSPPGAGGWGDVPPSSANATGAPSLHGISEREVPGPERWPAWGGDIRPADSPEIVNNPNPVNGGGGAGMMGADGAAAAGARPCDINTLTQQIAEQLRIAVNKGLIRMEILSQPLPQDKLIHLNTLLQKLPRLEQAQQELDHIRSAPPNPSQQHEIDRLKREIETLTVDINNLQRAISPGGNNPTMGGNPNGRIQGPPPPVSAGGNPNGNAPGSRLFQWKKSTNQSDDSKAADMNALMVALNLDDKPGDWSQGPLDWSNPGPPGPLAGADDADGRPAGSQHSDSPSNPLGLPVGDEGPQEFVPGKKWEWRDPNKLAEDPNATPGSVKLPGVIAPGFGESPFNGWNGISTGGPGADAWGKARPSQPVWFVVQLKGVQDKQMVRHLEQIAGPVAQSLTPPPGAVTIVKFQDPNTDAIYHRLAKELGPGVKAITQQELEAQQYGKRQFSWDAPPPSWNDAGPGGDDLRPF